MPNQAATDFQPMTTRSGRQLQGYRPPPRRTTGRAKGQHGSTGIAQALATQFTIVDITESDTGLGKHTRWQRGAAPSSSTGTVCATPTALHFDLGPAFHTPPVGGVPSEPPRLERNFNVMSGRSAETHLSDDDDRSSEAGDTDTEMDEISNRLQGTTTRRRVRVGGTGTFIVENSFPTRLPSAIRAQSTMEAFGFSSFQSQSGVELARQRLGPHGTHLISEDGDHDIAI